MTTNRPGAMALISQARDKISEAMTKHRHEIAPGIDELLRAIDADLEQASNTINDAQCQIQAYADRL